MNPYWISLGHHQFSRLTLGGVVPFSDAVLSGKQLDREAGMMHGPILTISTLSMVGGGGGSSMT